MRSLISIFILFLALTSCEQKPITLTINGTVTDSALNGQKVYLMNYNDYKGIDTTVIADSKFTFKVTQDTATIVGVRLKRLFAALILEDGVVDVELTESSKISGTPLNDSLSLLDGEIELLTTRMRAIYKQLAEPMADKEQLGKESSQLRVNANEIYQKSFDSNIGNMLGVYSFWKMIQGLSYEESKKMADEMAPLAENFGPIKSIMKAKAAYENTKAGKMFIDFDAVKPDGSAAKLSDYVGKGEYVLVDFWASWCGPCVREMPNIKDVYKNYKDKGLVVLGVNVWDKKDKLKSSIEEMGMDWNHIAIFEGTEAADAYGINGIPHIILFAPDGTIVERGLHGDAMKAKVAEMYK
jgi:thiol-disulfide isomerase/thioredoxin